MNIAFTSQAANRQRRARGMSLIELMVALVIATVLIGGMLQIFIATKASYQLQQGVARVQENGRFAMQMIERSARMAGYMGCGNDRTRIGAYADLDTTFATSGVNDSQGFFNHLSSVNGTTVGAGVVNGTATFPFRFERPIEAFEFNQALVSGAAPAVDATASHWTPPLPAQITGATMPPIGGSDVLVVRYFSEVSTPVLFYNSDLTVAAKITIDPTSTLANSLSGGGGLFAIANCRVADLFYATSYTPATGEIGAAYSTALNSWQYDATGSPSLTWFGFSNYGQSGATRVFDAELYSAKYAAIYVGLDGTTPVLLRQELLPTFTDKTGIKPLTDTNPEILAEGVENIRVAFGIDTATPKTDSVNSYVTVTQLLAGLSDPNDAIKINAALRQVLSIRLALLMRSPERSDSLLNNTTYTLISAPTALSRTVTPPNDGRFRSVYETNIALRNRIILRQN